MRCIVSALRHVPMKYIRGVAYHGLKRQFQAAENGQALTYPSTIYEAHHS